MNLTAYDLIKTPVVTEKSTILNEAGKYVFEVDKAATKEGVAKAVEKIFGAKVKKVNMINTKGKVKKFRGRTGKRSDVKKAIVTLEADQTIDLAAGVK